jgi:hypothetical protein
MTSEQLAELVERYAHRAVESPGQPLHSLELEVIEMAKSRILGVGNEQYSEGDLQKFQTVELDKLVEWAQEETVDQINYGAMILAHIEDPFGESDEGYMPSGPQRDAIEGAALDLIEQGIVATINLRDIRETLARAVAPVF